MPTTSDIGLLFLHALPLDGSMWSKQMDLVPDASYAPTLYRFGETIEDWANGALGVAENDKLIVVGCSIGGSCALELAVMAPERVAALVLIGTKAKHDPDPELHSAALDLIEKEGLESAWNEYWAPLFSSSANPAVVEAAKNTALRQKPQDIARGVTAFHSRKSRDGFVSGCRFPVIVISGEEDIAPGPKAGDILAESAPGGSFHAVPSCGHYVPIEQPDVLGKILRDVIATLP